MARKKATEPTAPQDEKLSDVTPDTTQATAEQSSTVEADNQALTDAANTDTSESAVENQGEVADWVATDENGVIITKGAIYRLNPNHPTEKYYRCGICFLRGERTEVDELALTVEQIERLMDDPHLELVAVIPMSKDEHAQMQDEKNG